MTTLIPRRKGVKDQKAFLKRSRLNRRTDKHYRLPVSQDRRVQVSQIPSTDTLTHITFCYKMRNRHKSGRLDSSQVTAMIQIISQAQKNTSRSRVSRQNNKTSLRRVAAMLLSKAGKHHEWMKRVQIQLYYITWEVEGFLKSHWIKIN